MSASSEFGVPAIAQQRIPNRHIAGGRGCWPAAHRDSCAITSVCVARRRRQRSDPKGVSFVSLTTPWTQLSGLLTRSPHARFCAQPCTASCSCSKTSRSYLFALWSVRAARIESREHTQKRSRLHVSLRSCCSTLPRLDMGCGRQCQTIRATKAANGAKPPTALISKGFMVSCDSSGLVYCP